MNGRWDLCWGGRDGVWGPEGTGVVIRLVACWLCRFRPASLSGPAWGWFPVPARPRGPSRAGPAGA